MVSTNIMLQKLSGLIDTTDVSEWENKFLTSIWSQTAEGKLPSALSERQYDTAYHIYKQHFA